jgi:hypothetical protein
MSETPENTPSDSGWEPPEHASASPFAQRGEDAPKPSPWEQPATTQPQFVHPGGRPAGGGHHAETSGKATASLVLGICGLVVCPLICSILALVFGYQGRAEIDKSGGRIGGRGNATAGIVLGWIGLVIGVLLIVLVIVLAATGNLEDTGYYNDTGEI